MTSTRPSEERRRQIRRGEGLRLARRGRWRPKARSSIWRRRLPLMPPCSSAFPRARASSSRSRWARISIMRPRSSKICRDRKLTAAVNFQLRFAPMMLAVRDALDRGLLGRLVDVEVHLAILTPMGAVRLSERSAARRDRGAFDPLSRSHPRLSRRSRRRARQDDRPSVIRHGPDPHDARFSTMATRSAAAMSINHNHAFGRKHQAAEFRFDGTEGAAHAKLGLLLDYPRGEPDELWIRPKGEPEWVEVPLAWRMVSRRLHRQNGQSAAVLRRRGP